MAAVRRKGSPDVAPYLGWDWHVSPTWIRPDAVAPPCPPALVVAPRYEPGATTSLVPLRPTEAPVVLAHHSFNLRHQGRPGLDTLARVVRRCDCYRMVIGELGVACELILELVGSTVPEEAA